MSDRMLGQAAAAPGAATANAPRGASRATTVSLAIMAICALAMLIALGVWQLRRLAWKEAILTRIEQSLKSEPAAYDFTMAGRESEDAREFRRVHVHGFFLPDNTVKMLVPTPPYARGRTNDAFGYLVFSRLGFEGGTVFVNRGFVPQSAAGAVLADSAAREAEITGFIRKSEKPGWLASEPDPAKKIFLFADIAAMAKSLNLDPARIITSEYIEADAASGGASWPMGRDPKDLLMAIPNNHLQYALTWFGLAAALAGIFGFRLFQNLRRRPRL